MANGDFWTKWERGDRPAPVSPTKPSSAGERSSSGRTRLRWRVLNGIAGLFWAYVMARLLVGSPEDRFLGDFSTLWRLIRSAIPLCILIAAGITTGRRFWWAGALFTLIWPLVIFVWIIPRYIWKIRNWTAAMAAIHVLFSGASSLPRLMVGFVAWFVCTSFVWAAPWDLAIAVGVLGALVLVSLAVIRGFRTALGQSTFLGRQTRMIRAVSMSNFSRQGWAPNPTWDSVSVERFDAEMAGDLVLRVSTGLMYHRYLLFWAYQVDCYRRSSALVLANLGSFVFLVIKIVWGFALASYGLWRIDPGQFAATAQPTFLTFLLMAATGLYFSSSQTLAATGNLAQTLSLLNGFVGLLLLSVGLVGITQYVKQRRDDAAAEEAVAHLRDNAEEFEKGFAAEYGVSLDEAALRLGDYAKNGLTGISQWFLEQIPPDFYGAPRSRGGCVS